MAHLAVMYESQERWKEAQELQTHVYQTRRSVLGEEHLDTLASKARLAEIRRRIARGDQDDEFTPLVRE